MVLESQIEMWIWAKVINWKPRVSEKAYYVFTSILQYFLRNLEKVKLVEQYHQDYKNWKEIIHCNSDPHQVIHHSKYLKKRQCFLKSVESSPQVTEERKTFFFSQNGFLKKVSQNNSNNQKTWIVFSLIHNISSTEGPSM